MEESIAHPAMPMPLRWHEPPPAWSVDESGTLRITAGTRTDLFVDPQDMTATLNAPRLTGSPSGDFLLSAHVAVEFAATYDAGVLVLYAHERSWAKVCFELSPQRQPMIVSVVTRGVSDDCNSWPVDGDTTWLRIARLGQAFAFHASHDGINWQLVRHFALAEAEEPVVGFLAQSPTGEGCAAAFADIRYHSQRLADLRSGV